MRCAIYCRVSSDRQREDRTIDSQREALEAYAKAQNWSVVAVEQDDGVSGTIEPWARPAMSRILAMVCNHSIEVLLVLDVDRVTRDSDTIAFAVFRKELREHGVQLATPKGTMDFDSPEQRLHQDMLAAIAGYERHKIKERTSRGRARAVREGGRPWGHLPRGYSWSTVDKAIVVAEKEAAAVREVFRLAAEEGLGMGAIARNLRRREIKGGRVFGGSEGFLGATSIKRILTTELYWSGMHESPADSMGGHVAEYPPLVSHQVWEAANRNRQWGKKPPSRRTGYEYLLRGLVTCAHCGRAMRAHSVKHTKATHAYYRCDRAGTLPTSGERCTNRGVTRAAQVDSLVWNYFVRLIREPDALRTEVERLIDDELSKDEKPEAAMRALDAEMQVLDGERARLVHAFRKGLVNEGELQVELDDIERKREPLLQRRDLVVLKKQGIEDQRARLAATEERLAAIRDVLDHLTFAERVAVVREMLDEVRLDGVARTVEIRGITLAVAEDLQHGGSGSGGGGQAQGSREDADNPQRSRRILGGVRMHGNNRGPGRQARARR